MAFGFDLSPLVARSEEFEAWAEDVRAEERALKLVRERITLCRRDIAKMIVTGVDEGVPVVRGAGQGPSEWSDLHQRSIAAFSSGFHAPRRVANWSR